MSNSVYICNINYIYQMAQIHKPGNTKVNKMQGRRGSKPNMRKSQRTFGEKGPLSLFARAGNCASVILTTITFAAFFSLASANVFASEKLSGGNFVIARNNIGADGRRVTAGGVNFNTAVGEAGITSAAGGGFRFHPGYMKSAVQPGSVVSITAMTKSTGTLDLSWQAPGLDGFQGDVADGFYRVDYSSDPLHAFRPTIYKLEFSTTVAAGSAQSLTVQGLLPNTTYYSKIYLSNAQKYFGEDSRKSEESTLANVPVAPFFSEVSAYGVVISWLLPEGGASGFRADGSTTSFGGLYPGGDITTAATPDGIQVNLALDGLEPGTTYFFKVASRNWQGDKNFAAIIATVTIGLMPARYLNAASNPRGRSVTLSWARPANFSPQGALVIMSTSPVPYPVMNGAAFAPGETLGDSSLVRSTANLTAFTDSGLVLDTPYFYHIYNQYRNFTYSISVSTAIFLDLPPMAPNGLTGVVTADGKQMQLNWQPVTANLDGSAFFSTAAPMAVELAQYRIERAASLSNPGWVGIATVPVTGLNFVDDIPDPDRTYYYRVSPVDSFNTSDNCMIADTQRNLFAMASDQVTRLRIPPELAGFLKAANNPTGKHILIRAVEQPEGDNPKVLRFVRFEAVTAGNQVLKQFQFPSADLLVTLAYKVAGSLVARSSSPFTPSEHIPAATADKNLAMYWDNGDKYVKLYGDVDVLNRTVSAKTAMTGNYQLRSLYRESGVTFDVSNLTNRMITPNGDGLNDEAIFNFDNPKDSAYSGKIYDAAGAYVADMKPGPLTDSLAWDGKAGGRAVPGGVYIYQIRAEGKVFNGTLVVVR